MAGNQKRLDVWQGFLRSLPTHDKKGRLRFDIEFYASGQFIGVGFDVLDKCNTAGCALGFATCIPEFQELGWHQSNRGVPMIGAQMAHGYAKTFFELSEDQVHRIVMSSSYVQSRVTPQMVADRIQQIMDE